MGAGRGACVISIISVEFYGENRELPHALPSLTVSSDVRPTRPTLFSSGIRPTPSYPGAAASRTSGLRRFEVLRCAQKARGGRV